METIAAIATPRGRAALGIIRVSGENSHDVVNRCVGGARGIKDGQAGRIRLFRFCDIGGAVIDEITAVRYDEPRSFTGENMVEIIYHGNPVIAAAIMERLCQSGARLAEGGEFSRRAVENGKMDLLRAEAIREMIESSSLGRYRSAVGCYEGSLGSRLEEWREKIIDNAGAVEAKIEFPEEDDVEGIALGDIRSLAEEIGREIEKRRIVRRLEEGVEIGIVGVKNAGKSSLFNSLVGESRSIVHSQEGTTRDLVSERVRIGGTDFRLVDTAGMGIGGEEVESIGIERSMEELDRADVLVWVTPADRQLDRAEKAIENKIGKTPVIGLVSKSDLKNPIEKLERLKSKGIECEAHCLIKEEDRARAIEFVAQKILELGGASGEQTVLISERHEEGAKLIREGLEKALAAEEEVVAAEFLREALRAVEGMFGRVDNQEIMNRVFSKFCIGK